MPGSEGLFLCGVPVIEDEYVLKRAFVILVQRVGALEARIEGLSSKLWTTRGQIDKLERQVKKLSEHTVRIFKDQTVLNDALVERVG